MEITPSLYRDLESRARRLLRARRMSSDPQTLSLVNEACVKLIKGDPPSFETRGESLAYCAKVLRSVLLDLARHRMAQRRGGGKAAQLPNETPADPSDELDAAAQLLDVNEKLEALVRYDAQLAYLVELRFFGGLTWTEVAEVMDCSTDVVQRQWSFAQKWLRRQLSDRD